MPKGVKGFVKGQSGNPNGRPEGAKGVATLAREERRAIFDAEVSKRWLETIQALKPEYVADQFIGKAKDTVDINLKGNINVTDPKLKELAMKFEEELKKKL